MAWRCPAAAWPRSRTNPRCQVLTAGMPTAKPAGTAQSGRVAKLAGAAVTGLFGAIVCTPPYAIARGGIYLLGSHFALGVPKPRSRLLTCSFLKRPADPPAARHASGLCKVHDRYSAGTHPARVRHRRSSSRLTQERAREREAIMGERHPAVTFCIASGGAPRRNTWPRLSHSVRLV